MNKKVQEYISKRNRKRLIRKIVFGTITLVIITGTILLKAPFFNLSKVEVKGNKIIKSEKVIDNKSVIGQNIFLLDTNEIKNEILKNPYVKTAEVKRAFPNSLSVNITERKMLYEVREGELTYVLNKDLVIMSILNDSKDLSLIEIKGIKIDNKEIGKSITSKENITSVASKIDEEVLEGKEELLFEVLDLSDLNSIKMSRGDIEIVIGKATELDEKYKLVSEIINNKNLDLKDGYIDVSFSGKPVIKNNLADEKKEGEE